MKIKEYAPEALYDQLRYDGLNINIGPFWFQVKSSLPDVALHFTQMYPEALIDGGRAFYDFPVAVVRKAGIRGWVRPLAEFVFNESIPFTPLPLQQSPALAEWGINWCVSGHAHQYLILHAAVVAKGNNAVLLPAPSGSGKSTLCAALVSRGWRLLSDELTLIRLVDSKIQPIPKPLSLKNASIDVIQTFWPDAVFGQVCHDTVKGKVAHLRPSAESVAQKDQLARAALIVFPQYQADAEVQVDVLDKGQAYMQMVENAFNYHLLGRKGFYALSQLLKEAAVCRLTYSNLQDGVATVDDLLDEALST